MPVRPAMAMIRSDSATTRIEAELVSTASRIFLASFEAGHPDFAVRADRYWLDLSLTPRPEGMRVCYADRWEPHRFVRVGEMFLIPAGETIYFKADAPVHQTSIVCELDAAAVDRWLSPAFDWNDKRLEACLDISHAAIRHLLRRLAEEARGPGMAGRMLAELMLGQLAIELARTCEDVVDGPVSGGLAPWRLRVIDERLREVRALPMLTELAELCTISVRQLTRGFRASRGCSIGDYAAQTRIETAKRLLGQGHSVGDIAAMLGFSSPSSFSYAFRRAIGITPRQFLHRVVRGR